MAHIRIDVERLRGRVHHRLFGTFLEHVGRAVYDGVWAKRGAVDREATPADGLQPKVLLATRELGPTCVRYPGGNFASAYHWQDGVGPRGSRPTRFDPAWGTVETNEFGTHEFLQFAAEVGAEPYLTVNLGDGTPEEAAAWVEYVNGKNPTEISRYRARNSRENPWGVKLWGLGNEMYGPWQIGQKSAGEYARVAREAAKRMRRVDPEIELVASGYEDGAAWNATVLYELAPYLDHLALHAYFGSEDTRYALAQPLLIEELAVEHAALAKLVLADAGVYRRVGIAFDEWGVWYRAPEPVLDEVYDLRDALVVAGCLNAMIRQASRIRLANHAQLVNVIGAMRTRGGELVRQSIYYPLKLYRQAAGTFSLDLQVDVERYEARVGSRNTKPRSVSVPYLDASATWNPEAGRILLAVVNRADTEISASVHLGGFESRRGTQVLRHLLTADTLDATNNFDAPDRVVPRSDAFDWDGKQPVTFPAYSLVLLEFS